MSKELDAYFRWYATFMNDTELLTKLPRHDSIVLEAKCHNHYVFMHLNCLTLFRMGFFGAAHGWGVGGQKGPLPKICHAYPTMMKLGTVIPCLKKIQKIYESHDTPCEFCWHQHFFTGNQQILLYQEIQI